MHILTKQALKFKNGSEVFITMGGGNIQFAPDWVAQTGLFKAAKQKELLFVMDQKPTLAVVQTPKVEPVPVVAPQTVEEAPAAETGETEPGFNLVEFNEKTIADAKAAIEAGEVDPFLSLIAVKAAKAGVRNSAANRLKEIGG